MASSWPLWDQESCDEFVATEGLRAPRWDDEKTVAEIAAMVVRLAEEGAAAPRPAAKGDEDTGTIGPEVFFAQPHVRGCLFRLLDAARREKGPGSAERGELARWRGHWNEDQRRAWLLSEVLPNRSVWNRPLADYLFPESLFAEGRLRFVRKLALMAGELGEGSVAALAGLWSVGTQSLPSREFEESGEKKDREWRRLVERRRDEILESAASAIRVDPRYLPEGVVALLEIAMHVLHETGGYEGIWRRMPRLRAEIQSLTDDAACRRWLLQALETQAAGRQHLEPEQQVSVARDACPRLFDDWSEVYTAVLETEYPPMGGASFAPVVREAMRVARGASWDGIEELCDGGLPGLDATGASWAVLELGGLQTLDLHDTRLFKGVSELAIRQRLSRARDKVRSLLWRWGIIRSADEALPLVPPRPERQPRGHDHVEDEDKVEEQDLGEDHEEEGS